MLTRRNFLACSCGLLMPGIISAKAKAGITGCHLSENDARSAYDSGSLGAKLESSGNKATDTKMGQLLSIAANTMEVNPAFIYYDDYDFPNALASSWKPNKKVDGLVMFGLQMLRDVWVGYGLQSVAGIIGHEFGHILQYNLNKGNTYSYLKSLHATNISVELHADYLSGFYLAQLKNKHPSIDLNNTGNFIKSIGNYSYTNADFHGTPDQRIAAAERGFFDAKNQSSITKIFNSGVDYVSKTI